jgi:hypothetical protein
MAVTRTDVDIRIDLKWGQGVESIKVYADNHEQREAGLLALLDINDELEQIEDKIRHITDTTVISVQR